MQWQDDPEIQMHLRERAVRNGILRSAIIWTPFFLLVLVLLVFFGFDKLTGGDRGSTWFLLVVLLIFNVLLGSQSIQSVADLLGKPHTVEGEISRRWARNDMFVVRQHYIRIGKRILRGDGDVVGDVKTGDTVKARFYPHSSVLVTVEKVETTQAQPPA
jgi:hypothetical protein